MERRIKAAWLKASKIFVFLLLVRRNGPSCPSRQGGARRKPLMAISEGADRARRDAPGQQNSAIFWRFQPREAKHGGRRGAVSWSDVCGTRRRTGRSPARPINRTSASLDPDAATNGTRRCVSLSSLTIFHSPPRFSKAYLARPSAFCITSRFTDRHSACEYRQRHDSRSPLAPSPAAGLRFLTRQGIACRRAFSRSMGSGASYLHHVHALW